MVVGDPVKSGFRSGSGPAAPIGTGGAGNDPTTVVLTLAPLFRSFDSWIWLPGSTSGARVNTGEPPTRTGARNDRMNVLELFARTWPMWQSTAWPSAPVPRAQPGSPRLLRGAFHPAGRSIRTTTSPPAATTPAFRAVIR